MIHLEGVLTASTLCCRSIHRLKTDFRPCPSPEGEFFAWGQAPVFDLVLIWLGISLPLYKNHKVEHLRELLNLLRIAARQPL